MGMAINAGAICHTVFFRGAAGLLQEMEIGFDLGELRVTTYRAVPLMPAEIWFFLTSRHGVLS
jgi:hypothetical protein